MKFDKTLWTYNCRDCVGEHEVWASLKHELEEIGQLQFYETIAQPLSEAVFEMQMNGMPLDQGRRDALLTQKREHLHALRAELRPFGELISEADFNPNSNVQVGKLLQAFGMHSGRLTDKGTIKADKLEIISSMLNVAGTETEKLFSKILDYRGESKDVGTFLEPVVPWPDGRVRTSFLTTARTGRLQSRKWITPWGIGPEFQNIPDDMRSIYVAPEGWCFINADASQLELVIMANEAGVQVWLDAIAAGESIHIANMTHVMKVTKEEALEAKARKARDYITIKKFVFADNYGADLTTIQEQLLTESRLLIPLPDLQRLMVAYRARVPEVEAWRNRVYPSALATRQITNRFGRVRRLFEPEDKLRGISFNHPIQSTGADFINIGFIKLWRRGLCLVNQVHDSVVILCRKEDRFAVKNEVLEAFSHTIPINGRSVSIKMDVQWGESWGETTSF